MHPPTRPSMTGPAGTWRSRKGHVAAPPPHPRACSHLSWSPAARAPFFHLPSNIITGVGGRPLRKTPRDGADGVGVQELLEESRQRLKGGGGGGGDRKNAASLAYHERLAVPFLATTPPPLPKLIDTPRPPYLDDAPAGASSPARAPSPHVPFPPPAMPFPIMRFFTRR